MIDVDQIFSQFLNSQTTLTALTSNRIWRITSPNSYKVSSGTALIWTVNSIESHNPIYHDKVLDVDITLRGYASNANSLRDLHKVLMTIFAGNHIRYGEYDICLNTLTGGQIYQEEDSENWTILLFLSTLMK